MKETIIPKMHQVYPDDIKSSRNRWIGVIASGITVLISLNGLIINEFFEYITLILIIIISLIALFIYLSKTKEWERLLIIASHIEQGYYYPLHRLSQLGAHISKMSMHPECHTPADLDELLEVVVIVDSNRVELVEALKNARDDSKVLEKDKRFFDSLIEKAEERMRQVSLSCKQKFDSQNTSINIIYPLVEKMVENYS
jgi:hypothetical protein